jgi:hypothetical protein
MGLSGQRHALITLYPRGKDLADTHWTGGWVDPWAGLATKARGKNLSPLPGIEPRLPCRPVRSQTLYCLSYSRIPLPLVFSPKILNVSYYQLYMLYAPPILANLVRNVISWKIKIIERLVINCFQSPVTFLRFGSSILFCTPFCAMFFAYSSGTHYKLINSQK